MEGRYLSWAACVGLLWWFREPPETFTPAGQTWYTLAHFIVSCIAGMWAGGRLLSRFPAPPTPVNLQWPTKASRFQGRK